VDPDNPQFLQMTGTGFGSGLIFGTLLVLLLAGGGIAVALAAGTGSVITLIAVLVGLVVAAVWTSPLITASLARGSIRLSHNGIMTSGSLMQRSVGWDEITAIEVLKTRAGRIACIRLRDGTHRQLAAPRDTKPRPDPGFDEKVQTIHRWWELHRTP
jgi:hypothetical protein